MAAKRLTPPASERAGTYEFNPEFQAHLLAVCLLTPDFVLRFGTALKPEYFGAVEHRDIASCLFAFVDKHKCLPHRDTFLEALRTARGSSSPALRAQIAKDLYGQDAGDGAAVAEVAVSFGRQRAVANAILAAAEKVQRNDMGDMLSGIQQAMMVGEDLTNLGIVYKDTERFEAYRQRLDPRDIIPTGIGHLDFALDGGLRRGELGVISSPPKRGKTSTLINLVFGAITHVQGYTVVHYSLEMDKHDVAARYDARLLGDKCILRYQDMDAYLVELQASLAQVVGNLRVQQYFTRAASIQTVRSHLSILAAQGFVPDLVVVDYADIMRPVRRLGEHRHEQAGIYEDLRQLAGEFNCGVWTASQTNRLSLDEETVGLVHTAESLEKVMIADLIISFCQTRDEAAHGLCRLFGAGCRRVDDGFTVECAINRKQCRITSTALLSAVNEEMPIPTSGKTHVARQAVRRIREAHAAGSVATGNKRSKEGEPPRRVRRLGVHA